MSKMLKLLVASILFVLPLTGYACKEAALNENFPIYDLSAYDSIVVAKINSVADDEKSRYGGFSSFTATVQEVLKGSLKKGMVISAKPEHEEAKAVCPTQLKLDNTYLLLLRRRRGFYSLSRFSFPTSSTHIYYLRYLQEVKERLSQKTVSTPPALAKVKR